LSKRTLACRKTSGRLSASESERLVRLGKLFDKAALEIVVHLPEEVLLNDLYACIPTEFDSKYMITLKPSQLPSDWNIIPPPESTQKIGSDWAKTKQSLVLKVPSSVIPAEHNYLINPQHPDAKRLKIGKAETFDFDTRIKR
jgi:RES domain-containing protein